MIATLRALVHRTAILLAAFATAGAVSLRAAEVPELERGFREPPPAARPWTYWFIMDGNLSREGITADFEAIRRAGLGGVIIMEVNVGIPRGPVEFMGTEWRQLFRHAVREAERLGLEITLNAGPGWTGSGGPWVSAEQSMQHLVASATEVTGPKPFDELLPQPQRRPAFFGEQGLPPDLRRTMDEFYRDVVVLAFPTPAGDQRIEHIDEKALYVRAPYSSQPAVRPFFKTFAEYPALPAETVIDPQRIVDLTGRLTAEGRLEWAVPPGKWTILRFGRTSTGANTRPAPAPGLGLECDKFDPAALEAHFDAFVGALLREVDPRPPGGQAGWTMLHIDSWEMGAQNWTAAFREEFRRRRGYDLLVYLPAMTGRVVGSREESERFLWDLRQTAQELVIANHARQLKQLGARHGFGLSIEPYDMNPSANMSLGAVADVPMCEFWLYGFDTAFSVIEAASTAHTLGRPVVAAEAFTSSDAERWRAHPATMKTLGDWAFCAGVNRIVFHRYQHQPWPDRYPGMTMGPYGVHWERTQTWWELVPAYHEYLARCQWMLRQGLAVADICYLVAEGAPHVFRPPASATTGRPPDRLGYNFDGITAETLAARVSVRDGRLVLPDGLSYRVLVLPESPTMTPELLRTVRDLVAAGATLLGPPPVKSPSLARYPECDAEVRRLADELWGNDSVAAGSGDNQAEAGLVRRSFGQGSVFWQPSAPSSEPVPAAVEEPLEGAQWIWTPEGNAAEQAVVGKRYFARPIVLQGQAPVRSARVFMTADNSFELYVNGRSAGSGDNFHIAYTIDVARSLQPGTNLLAVVAENGGTAPNPAGLIGALVIEFADGRRQREVTSREWRAAVDVPADSQGTPPMGPAWTVARELGPAGIAPWGPVRPAEPPLEQYGDYTLVARVLQQLSVPPDFESDGPLRYTHRRLGDTDVYFVANRQADWVAAQCRFRVTGRAPELWDPLTGEVRRLAMFAEHAGQTVVPLQLKPAGSVFVVFRAGPGGELPAKPVEAVRAFTHNGRSVVPAESQVGGGRLAAELWVDADDRYRVLAWEPGQYAIATNANRMASVHVAELPEPVSLRGPWTVRFQPGRGAPEQLVLPELSDWSTHAEAGVRHFSGTATYRTRFPWHPPATEPGPSAKPGGGRWRHFLDLGDVAVMGRVTLNGRDLGVVWKAPFRVEVTDALQPGENLLEVTVANLWPNRLIGDQGLPVEQRVSWTTWNPWPANSPLLPSGLLGPVQIVCAAELAP